eukprot:34092_5
MRPQLCLPFVQDQQFPVGSQHVLEPPQAHLCLSFVQDRQFPSAVLQGVQSGPFPPLQFVRDYQLSSAVLQGFKAVLFLLLFLFCLLVLFYFL